MIGFALVAGTMAIAQVGIEPWLENGAVVVIYDPTARTSQGEYVTTLEPRRTRGPTDLPTFVVDHGMDKGLVRVAPVNVKNVVWSATSSSACTCTWFGEATDNAVVGLAPSDDPNFDWKLVEPLLTRPIGGRDWILDVDVDSCPTATSRSGDHCASSAWIEGRRYFRGGRRSGRRLAYKQSEAIYLRRQLGHTLPLGQGRGLMRDLDKNRRWRGEISERRFLARLDRRGFLRWAIDWGLVPADAVPWERDRGRPDERRREADE